MPHIEGGESPPKPTARAKSVHTVDWTTLQQIRVELCKRVTGDGEPMMSSEELAQCWLQVAELEQSRQGSGPLCARDKEFIEIRVSQSMREVDPQCSGQVDVDVWVHHMLLTRSSPPAMRAMLQINRLLEAALQLCPGILVGLQHAFEVALQQAANDDTSTQEDAASCSTGGAAPSSEAGACLPFGEVVSIYGRKLWHLRPGAGAKDCPQKRRTDFGYKTPDEFIRNTVKAMELDEGSKITSGDFLALCLGRREWQVTLHLYDLSKGMAAVLSPWLLKEQLEGVWHTGIVVFGKEYYFGGDIYYDTPGETGFGKPRLAVHIGSTLRQRDELHAFIVDELKPIFTREAYDAARNNCNHFTDRVAMYLVGKHIPEEVLAQPEIMMGSSLGRTLRPILTRVLGQYAPLGKEISVPGALGNRAAGTKEVLAIDGSTVGSEEQLYGKTVAL